MENFYYAYAKARELYYQKIKMLKLTVLTECMQDNFRCDPSISRLLSDALKNLMVLKSPFITNNILKF